MSEREAIATGPMEDAVNGHIIDHLVNGPVAHRELMEEAKRVDEHVRVLMGMILEYHDRTHAMASVDECAATLCRQYVTERERAMLAESR